MYIDSLQLRNFRNYQSLELKLHPRINLFVGNNAQGKTNVLEAIYLLATTKSFRATKEAEMIKYNEQSCLIKGRVQREACHTLEIVLHSESAKIIKFNRKVLTPSDFVGNFNVVLFTPEDLYLIKGSPAARRRFLDIEISQVNATYRSLLAKYQKILQQRNVLLKKLSFGGGDLKVLEVWDDQLIDIGSRIMVKRSETIHKLGLLSRLMHRKLSDGQEELNLRYSPFYLTDDVVEDELDLQQIKSEFQSALKQSKQVELKRGYSLVGPQRDDLRFMINNMDARIYGSQGQQRTAVLACRLAELEYMKSETGDYPAILLDDVMSELDDYRKIFLLQLLQFNVQTIITTTDSANFGSDLLQDCAYFHVNQGQIREGR